MKAAVIQSVGEIGIESVDDPTSGPGQTVVQVAAVGLYTTELHILQGVRAVTATLPGP